MGVRAESRERTVNAVMALGREQLAEVGAAGLSLRAIARELGLVSSAVYRYFPSRDALLTALIVEAYDEVGAAAEDAERQIPRSQIDRRILAIAEAFREWALANPNEYALIFGSPVPDYDAPPDTIGPASRVPLLMLDILRDLPPGSTGSTPFAARARRAVRPLHAKSAPDIDPALLSLGYSLWEFIIGAVSVEVFGHQTNVIDDDPSIRAAFFREQVRAISTVVTGG